MPQQSKSQQHQFQLSNQLSALSQLASKRSSKLSAALCLGAILLPSLPQPSFAQAAQILPSTQLAQRRRRQYRPPADARIPRRNHSGGGVRGCGEEIAVIAPRLSGIGQTVSAHPTFVWYNYSDSAEPLELHLYRYQSEDADSSAVEPVFIREVGSSQKGYMSYTLPESEPGLQIGETYFWQVVLYCDPNLEEVGMWTAADIQRVPDSVTANRLSGEATSDSQAYAEAGLWYDAIATLDNLNTPASNSLRQAMLLDLADLEAETSAASAPTIVEQLRQIAEE